MGIVFVKKLCYLFIVLSCFTCFCITPSQSLTCFTFFKWFVHIHDGIPNSTVSVHVKSRDDDLGFHNITYHNSYVFRFCENLIHNTVFAGDFSYGKKFVHFNVFDQKVVAVVGGAAFRENPIHWLLKEKAYYVSKHLISYDDPAWILIGHW
ncbi:hypothetical protein R6Q57_005878 [Mikania cordata]